MTVAERVKRRRGELDLTQQQLARRAGLSQVTISDIERGRNKGSRELVALAVALDMEPEELASGRRKRQEVSGRHTGLERSTNIGKDSNPITTRIEVGTVELGLRGAEGADIQAIEVSKAWVERTFSGTKTNRQTVLLPVLDDSMSPTFTRGDTLLVDLSVREFDGDGIYAFTSKEDFFVKRVQRLPDGRLRVISDNRDKYEPYVVETTERNRMRVRGRVVYTWGGKQL